MVGQHRSALRESAGGTKKHHSSALAGKYQAFSASEPAEYCRMVPSWCGKMMGNWFPLAWACMGSGMLSFGPESGM